MIRALGPAIAALAVFLIACGDNGPDPTDASQTAIASPPAVGACTPARPQTSGDSSRTLQSGGAARTYLVHVPPSYTGAEAIPLVLGFPAGEMTAETFADFTTLPATADEHGFALMLLNATDGRWNPGGDGSASIDVAFATAVLDEVSERYCIDSSRVYATGYSTGGGMAQAVACAMPDRVAAFGVVASTFQACRADVPMIAFHGIADPAVPFEGGAKQALSFPSVRRAVSEWARNVGCDGLAAISRPSSEVELSTYKRCFRGDGEVLLYSIVNGGHTWPGSPVSIEQLGFTTQQVDATTAIWEFFEAHPKLP